MNFYPVFHHLQRKRTTFTRASPVGSGGRVVGHFFPLVFASLGEFVLLDFGSFWKIRSKRLLHGRQSAAQAEQLPGRQSVHFFLSLNECLYRWNFKSPAIYIMERFFLIYIYIYTSSPLCVLGQNGTEQTVNIPRGSNKILPVSAGRELLISTTGEQSLRQLLRLEVAKFTLNLFTLTQLSMTPLRESLKLQSGCNTCANRKITRDAELFRVHFTLHIKSVWHCPYKECTALSI